MITLFYILKIQKNVIIFILSIILVFKYVNNTSCPKYNCEVFKDPNICAKTTPIFNNTIFDYYNVSIRNCGENYYCNYTSLSNIITESNDYYCNSENNYPLVDNEKCISNSDCASNNCQNNRCLGRKLNQPCTSTKQCQSLAYCSYDLNVCLPSKNFFENCFNDEECMINGGCLNGICTRYWSLEDLSLISDEKSAELYCKSGYSKNGKCDSIILHDNSQNGCDSSCNYTLASTGLNVTEPELCTCGFNPDGNKYCQLGTNSYSFMRFVDISNLILQNNCHASKKFTCDIINYYDKINRQYYYYAWKGKLQKSDSCIANFFANSNYLSHNFSLLIGVLFLIFI